MDEVLQYLKDSSVFYLASVEGDLPHVRPFGAVAKINGRLYLITGKKKDVSRQIAANDHVELCAMGKDGGWLRVAARAVRDESRDVKVKMLEEFPDLKALYSPDDGNMEMLYLADAAARFCSMTAPERSVTF